MTKIIEIYGAPGDGKTTAALRVTVWLKEHGYNAVFVPEYATELAYAGTLSTTPQREIVEEQCRRVLIPYGQADFVVTDSPVPMSAAYASYGDGSAEVRARYLAHVGPDALRYVIQRPEGKGHDMRGRITTEQESNELRHVIRWYAGLGSRAYDAEDAFTIIANLLTRGYINELQKPEASKETIH